MGAGSCQPLAKSKGVHREVESEGSWRQSSDPRNTNIIRHKMWDESANTKRSPINYTDTSGVNVAGTWNESYASYRGRSHGRDGVNFESRLKQDLS